MSKRCPDCGTVNEDSRIYCASCGEPLDAELRLMRDLENLKKAPPPPKEEAPAAKEDSAPRRKKQDDDDFTYKKMAKEKKTNPVPFIILGLVVVAAVIAFIVLS